MSTIPNSVSILGVLDAGQVLGCTISSLVSVDIENPELMFALKNSSATLRALSSVGALSINVLSSSQEALAVYYSTSRGHEIYLESERKWNRSKSGVIYLENSYISFICKINRIIPMVSATLVFCVPEESFCKDDLLPLMYMNRKFFSLSQNNTS